jgi:hypothetical protein
VWQEFPVGDSPSGSSEPPAKRPERGGFIIAKSGNFWPTLGVEAARTGKTVFAAIVECQYAAASETELSINPAGMNP